MKKIKRWIARQREGIFFGGLGGLIIFILKDRIPFVDKLVLESGWFLNTSTFIFIGASVGALIDSIIWKRK